MKTFFYGACLTGVGFLAGCAQPTPEPATQTPAPTATSQTVPLPAPDRALWKGKDLATALKEYYAATSAFTAALKEVQSAADVPSRKASIVEKAQRLRVTRFALADLSKGASQEAATAKDLSDSAAAVAQEVARLIAIPEARQELNEAFLLVRSAPAPQF